MTLIRAIYHYLDINITFCVCLYHIVFVSYETYKIQSNKFNYKSLSSFSVRSLFLLRLLFVRSSIHVRLLFVRSSIHIRLLFVHSSIHIRLLSVMLSLCLRYAFVMLSLF